MTGIAKSYMEDNIDLLVYKNKTKKYKCKVNVPDQEYNSDISCYKFIFNQNISYKMSQKNLLLLMLSCTIIFVTIKGSRGGGGGGS